MAALSLLADGIIPPDGKDAGAGSVNAGERLAVKLAAGVNEAVYQQGLALAEALARDTFGCALTGLEAERVHTLLGLLREKAPGFFKQLRMDVSGLYLSEPAVWERIGFPGPSTATGGHPDFDQPQGPPP